MARFIVGEMKDMIKVIKEISLKTVIVGMILIYLPASFSAAETIKIDLKYAVNRALREDETYLAATRETDKANSLVVEAVSGALPQITGGMRFLRNWEIPTGVFQMGDEVVTFKFGTENSYVADLTLTQPLYSGGRTITALKIARIYKKMTAEMVRQARQDLKIRVFTSFYGALLARELYRVNEESFGLASENLEVVGKLYDQGMVAEYDYLRARVGVANVEPMLIKARTDAEVAENALKNMLGFDTDIQIELDADMDSNLFVIPPISTEDAVLELKGNRPEVKLVSFQTSLNKQMISIARAGYRPSLFFSSSLQYQSQFDRGSVFEKKWDRSLNSVIMLSVPIFDSWRTPSKVKQAKIEMIQSELKEEAVIKNMVLDFKAGFGRYNEARQRFSAQGDAVELARRGLSISNVRYESGVGTQLEVADARLSLSSAEINRAMAFHDLAVSYALLMRSLGREIELF